MYNFLYLIKLNILILKNLISILGIIIPKIKEKHKVKVIYNQFFIQFVIII